MNYYEQIPYTAIGYLIGECNYGGRVTDTYDRRLLCTILDDYVNEPIVTDRHYKFMPEQTYNLPGQIDLEHSRIQNYIEANISDFPGPEVYGLHANAGIQKDLNSSSTLLNSVLILTQGTGGSSGADANIEQVLVQTVITISKRYKIQS